MFQGCFLTSQVFVSHSMLGVGMSHFCIQVCDVEVKVIEVKVSVVQEA